MTVKTARRVRLLHFGTQLALAAAELANQCWKMMDADISMADLAISLMPS